MSKSNADILAKLKIKNIPVSKERLDIIIPAKQPMEKETIELKTKVVDKTKFAEFDRESFLKMITGIATTITPVVIAGPGPLPLPLSLFSPFSSICLYVFVSLCLCVFVIVFVFVCLPLSVCL